MQLAKKGGIPEVVFHRIVAKIMHILDSGWRISFFGETHSKLNLLGLQDFGPAVCCFGTHRQ